jgi:hypothetical protein
MSGQQHAGDVERARWRPSELLPHAEVVAVGPVLGHRAVSHAKSVGLGGCEAAAQRWKDGGDRTVGPVGDEWPGLPAGHRGVYDDEVIVLDAGPTPRVSGGSFLASRLTASVM